MPRHSPRRLRPARMRSPRGALSALLAIALATPAIALASGASPTKPVALPDCINLPAAKMAGLLGVSAFVAKGLCRLGGELGGVCLFERDESAGELE